MISQDWKVDFDVLEKYLQRGLSSGLGSVDNQVCVEQAVCLALGLEPTDNPPCTDPVLRRYKVELNDKSWSSPEARAKGMRALAYAQIGTRDNLTANKWVSRLAELTIRVLLPELGTQCGYPRDLCLRCAEEGTTKAALAFREHAYAANAAYAAAYAAAAAAANAADKYLTLSANLALRALQEQGFGVDQEEVPLDLLFKLGEE